ncbi:hypothetical protein HDV00_000779 [Rhizophlyctis rosea]|nr:hypothetical protein HDV00_000779 [Rhizophlyctis rosea]
MDQDEHFAIIQKLRERILFPNNVSTESDWQALQTTKRAFIKLIPDAEIATAEDRASQLPYEMSTSQAPPPAVKVLDTVLSSVKMATWSPLLESIGIVEEPVTWDESHTAQIRLSLVIWPKTCGVVHSEACGDQCPYMIQLNQLQQKVKAFHEFILQRDRLQYSINELGGLFLSTEFETCAAQLRSEMVPYDSLLNCVVSVLTGVTEYKKNLHETLQRILLVKIRKQLQQILQIEPRTSISMTDIQRMFASMVSDVGNEVAACWENGVKDLSAARDVYIRHCYGSDRRILFTLEANHPSASKTAEIPVFTQRQMILAMLEQSICMKTNLVQLVDNGYFVANDALDESSAKQCLLALVSEAAQYPSSMLIFDLDSIAQVRTEVSGVRQQSSSETNMEGDDGSAQYVVHRQDLLSMTLQVIKDHIDVSVSGTPSFSPARRQTTRKAPHTPTLPNSANDSFNSTTNGRPASSSHAVSSGSWLVAMAEHPYIARRFRETIKWPLTPGQKRQRELQEELSSEKECKRCGERFLMEDADSLTCRKHRDDEVYCDSQLRTAVAAVVQLAEKENTKGFHQLRLPHGLYKTEEEWLAIARETNLPFTELRFRCCGRGLGEEGCMKATHVL